MVEVARAESGIRQFDANGNVIMSPTKDAGLFQINWVNWDTAKRLGYDIYTVEGNIAMAKYLLRSQGLNAWSESAKNWLPHLKDPNWLPSS